MVESRSAIDPAGARHDVHSTIHVPCAEALYRTVLARRPRVTVEVGMAFGFSTLAILTALEEIGEHGQLISIDPWQQPSWHYCGRAAVERAGLATRHRLIEKLDYEALPQLLQEKAEIDFAYIDGNHTFDYVLVDFWYLDKLLRVGGLVGFNDCDWPAVHKAIKFVLTHRRYLEADVGLASRYVDYSAGRELIRRLRGVPRGVYYRNASDRYFVKQESWEPRWDFFAAF
jgi:predicted O-methyltransferase YrrM